MYVAIFSYHSFRLFYIGERVKSLGELPGIELSKVLVHHAIQYKQDLKLEPGPFVSPCSE